MSKVGEVISEPKKIMTPEGAKTARIIFETYKVEKDEDMMELMKIFAEGVEVMLQMDGQNCSYLVIKKLKDIKVAL